MNVAEAEQALDASATRVLNFAQLNNWRSEGTFALFVQDIDEASVRASQQAELDRAPDRPLMATAGMKPGAYAILAQLVPVENRALDLVVKESKTVGDLATIWMSTHVAERTTQAEFVAAATGKVLVAGLGLGLVLGPLLDKPEVTEIVVVDVNPEVHAVMAPYLETLGAGARLRLVRADINRWRCRQMFDTIYFDIWPNISAKNLVEMFKLRRRYDRHLMASGWMGCWAQDECVEMLWREAQKFPKIAKVYNLLVAQFGMKADFRVCHVDEGAA